MVVRNFGVDRYRDVGHVPCEQLFSDPFASDDRIGVGIGRMRHQPGRVGENAHAVGHFEGLLDGIVPVILLAISADLSKGMWKVISS